MRLRSIAVLFAVFAGILTACGNESEEIVEATPDVVEATARDFGFSGVPETISGNVIELTFRNDGKADHEFAMLQIGDKSAQDLSKAIAGFDEGAPFPEWFRVGTAVGEIPPGETLERTFTLPAGEYTLFCALTDAPGEGEKEVKSHATLGMFQKVTVEGDDAADPDALDAPGGTFAARDYTFEVPEDLAAGEQEFVFRNDSSEQWHHMILSVFPAGTTEEEARKAFEASIKRGPDQPPPAGEPEPEEAGFTGILSPGLAQTVTLDLESGRTYVAVCFIQDVAGGPPHAIAHKMIKTFTVAA